MTALHALLRQHTGLLLTAADVGRAVRERAGPDDAGQAAYAPLPGTPEFEALLDLLVVPESWMLRDPAVFTHALRFVQRRLLERPGVQVRILSLPCAGGEEPYSMALLLAEAGITPAQCRIDAVDLSRAAIDRARQGRYTMNAFRGADTVSIDAMRARWFAADGEQYVIAPGLRDYVCFSQGNLFALPDHMTGRAYDLVFCRNLLIYFDDDACVRAAGRLAALLADGGQLLAGYAEAPALCAQGFAPASLRMPFALARTAPPARSLPRIRKPLPGRAPERAPERAREHLRERARPPVQAPAPARAGPHVQDDTAPLLAQARRDADAGRIADARAACTALLRAAPGCAEAYYLLALLSECTGDHAGAQAAWQRCLYLDPDHYEALCGLALLHEGRGDASLAAGLRRRAARVFARRGAVNGIAGGMGA